jgi:hypothetical protein
MSLYYSQPMTEPIPPNAQCISFDTSTGSYQLEPQQNYAPPLTYVTFDPNVQNWQSQQQPQILQQPQQSQIILAQQQQLQPTVVSKISQIPLKRDIEHQVYQPTFQSQQLPSLIIQQSNVVPTPSNAQLISYDPTTGSYQLEPQPNYSPPLTYITFDPNVQNWQSQQQPQQLQTILEQQQQQLQPTVVSKIPQIPLKRERKPIIITDPNTHETINLKEKFQQKAEQTTTETQLKPDNKQSKATYSNPNINNQQQQNTTKLEYPIISKLAVLIENVSLDVLENILCFYESEKRTGGESIQKYKLNEKNGDLIIFYESQNVVARVLNFGLIIINKQFYKAVPYCKYFSFFYL